MKLDPSQFKHISHTMSEYISHLKEHLAVREEEMKSRFAEAKSVSNRHKTVIRTEAMTLAIQSTDKPISLPFRAKLDDDERAKEEAAAKVQQDDYDERLFAAAEAMYEWITQDIG